MNSLLKLGRSLSLCSVLSLTWSTAVQANDAGSEISSLQCQPAKLNVSISESIPSLEFCRTDSMAADNAQPITAQKLLDVSVQNSVYLKSQKDLVDSAVYSLKSATGNWWPNVSMSNSSYLFVNNTGNNNPVTTGCTNNPATAGKAFNPFNGSNSCSAASSYGQAYPVITITWNFINPSRYPQIAGAQKSIKLAQSQANQSAQQLQMSVLKSYGSYLLSGYQLGELRRLINIEQSLLADTDQLVQQHGLPRFALSQQTRNLLAYQARIEEAIASQQQGYLELTTALKKSSTEKNQAILPDLSSLVLREWGYGEEESVKMALATSEQLKQLDLQRGIATDSANQVRGQILPTIGVLGYVTYQGTDASGVHSGLLSNYAGLQVTWNLFDGYTTKNQAISSDRQAASYGSQYEAAKIQLQMQVKTRLQRLSLLKSQLGIYLNDIKHTESIAADLRSRQRFGITSQAEVLQAEQAKHESRLQLISTIASYVTTYTELAYLCGVDPLT